MRDIEEIINKLDKSVKSWYIKEFPNDDVGQTLSNETTFLDLNNTLNSGKGRDVYDLLGGDADTIVRERVFSKLAELTNQKYSDIYDKWINAKEDYSL